MSVDELSFKQRLSNAGEDVAYAQKGGRNEAQKYSFLEEAEVKAKVNPTLRKHGLVITAVEYTPVGPQTPDSAVLSCTVTISDVFSDAAVRFQGMGCGSNRGKAVMAACAVSLKYAMTSGFQIATGDDPENDKRFPEPATKSKDAEPKPKPTATETPNSWVSVLYQRIVSADTAAALQALKQPIYELQGKVNKEDFAGLVDTYKDKAKALAAQETK